MKKLLLTFFTALTISNGVNAQCSATAPSAFMQCAYYGDMITAFSLNGIPSVGNGGCGTSGYNLFATPVRTLVMGNTYAWTSSTGNYYSNGFGMWIDWNNDGSYVTAENVAATNYAYNHSGTITVPYNAVVGVNLRMRIRCAEYYNFSASTSPCNSLNGYGETEDYYVYISCPSALPSLSVTTSNTYICLGQSATLTASGAQSYTWTGGTTPVTNGVGFSPTVSATYTVSGGIAACPSLSTTAVRTVSVTNIPLPITASSSSSLICSGTSATLTASGANNFTWSPGILPTNSVVMVSPTANTTYSVIGYSGSGCPGAATLALTVSAQPTVAAVGTSSTVCAGGTVTLSASGANSYTWSPGGVGQSITVSPSIATLYNVVGINSSGCTGQSSAIVLVNPSPTVNVSATSTFVCLGGSVTLNATGASSYAWTGGPSTSSYVVVPTTSTSYTVTGTSASNGCTAKKTIAVNVFSPLVSVHPSTAICTGAAITLTASGASGYTWSPGGVIQNNPVSPTSTTLYTLTANSQTAGITSCKSTYTVQVAVNQNPTVTAVASPSSICKFGTATLTASGASSYLWNNASTSSNIVVTPTVGGTQVYSVTGTDANGCKSGLQVVLGVSNCTSLKELSSQNPINIFPNPNKGDFTIKYDQDLELNLVNELGQLVQSISLNKGNEHQVSVSELPAGIYFLVGQNDKGQIMQKIIVK